MKTLTLAWLACTTALPAMAHDFHVGDIRIEHPYAFETPGSARSAGGYMTLVNQGDTADTLTGVDGVFDRVMLHKSTEADGVATMEYMDSVDIPPGGTVDFAPGGYHVMFMGLGGNPWKAGDKIDATLTFAHAGKVAVQFEVQGRDDVPGDHAAAETGPEDEAQIRDLMTAQFAAADEPVTVEPVTIRGDEALAGWSRDTAGGRAYLHKGRDGWSIVAYAGKEMFHSSLYQRYGMTPEAAIDLIKAEAMAEAALGHTTTVQLDRSEGIVEVTPPK